MAMMDMTVALTNPYTQTAFDVLRRKQITNNFGEAKKEIEIVPGVRGVLYPEGSNDLDRKSDAQLQTKTITVLTMFAMRGESESANSGGKFQPDVIRWNANHFLVKRVEDYSKYARGFVKVTAHSFDMIDQAPVTTGPQTGTELQGSGYGIDPFGGGSVPG